MKDEIKWLDRLKEMQDHIGLENLDQWVAGGFIVVRFEDNLPVEYVNERMLDYLGYNDAGSYLREIESGMMQVFYKDDREYVQQEMKQQLAEGSRYRVMCQVTNQKGKPVWFYHVAMVIPDSPKRLYAFFYEIDEVIRPIQLMTNDMFSAVWISVTDWTVLDSVGEHLKPEQDCDSFFASQQETIPDPGMQAQFHHIFNQKNMLRELDAGKNKLSYVYHSRQIDGRVLWMEIRADMILRENDEVLAVIQVRDINHQMLVDQMRNSLIGRLTDFIAYYTLSDGTSFILSEKPEYTYESDQQSGALQKLSHTIYQKVSSEEQQKMRKQLDLHTIISQLDQTPDYQYTVQLPEQDHTLRTKRMTFYYLDQYKDVIVILQQDITDLFREESLQKEELQRALDIATQASHTREEFLSNMSHDLRTPLNGIIGASELARDQIQKDPALVAEYLSDIHSSGHFMLNLVNDILDMSRLELGKQELEKVKIDWDVFTRDLLQVLEPICRERGLQIQIELDRMPAVMGDAVQLRRILQNLLSNAIKFTTSDGQVECRVADTKMIGETLLATILIRDNGIGMGAEFQEHMFETFTRESNEINDQKMGSGFGLAIVKSLVDLMGGSIRCESKKGEGTSFYVSLPFELYRETPEHQKKKRAQIEKKILRGCKILLAEDHPLNAKIVKRLLENMEITVEHAVNGQEAVDYFQRSDLFFYDAILMDISMPVMDGIEATQRIRAMDRSDAHMIPIIALTANAFEKDIQKSKSAGMNDHLLKPLDSGKLFETLIHFWKQ